MTETKTNGANLGFENQMWAAADKLRGHMDASEYKHVVLGLIFETPGSYPVIYDPLSI
jgi:type I restriction enzyme M protein